MCVIGSTNWTDSSTANLEFSATLLAVGESFEEARSREFAKGGNRVFPSTPLSRKRIAGDSGDEM